MAVISPVLEEKEEEPRNKQRVRGMTDDQAEGFMKVTGNSNGMKA